MIHKLQATHLLLALTTGKNYRYKYSLRAEYKGKRNPSSFPLYYALKEFVKTLPYTFACDEIEPDDLVSIIANDAHFKEQFEDIIICSPDKDVLFQNAGTHYNYRTDELVTVSLEESYKFLCKQLLMGDSTDNIIGIKNVGPEKAANFLQNQKDPENYLVNIFDKYLQTYKLHGISYLNETFKLVYLLKSLEDLKLEVSEDFFNKVRNLQFILLNESTEDKSGPDEFYST